MKTVGLIANLKKKNASRVSGKLEDWLKERDLKVVRETEGRGKLKRADLVIALGGDGTLLHTTHLVGSSQIPLLGVNLGGLGFLTEITLKELYPVLRKILKGKFEIEERMMIKATIGNQSSAVKKSGSLVALNDIVINIGTLARVINLEIYINGEYISTYTADGLIISTPTGSSAYSLSAGGPLLNPRMKAIILTPICPHALAIRPLVISQEEKVRILVKSDHNDIKLTVDGQESFSLNSGQKIEIEKAPYSLKLVKPEKKSFYEILRKKLNWGGLKIENQDL
jgi:NAD+ kinase